MAETKIIPLELKELICSHLLSQYNDSVYRYLGMTPYDRHRGGYPTATRGIIPLDIPDVRKTQRRVAALLGRDPVDVVPRKAANRRSHESSLYTESDEVHSIRRLLGPGNREAHRRDLILHPPRIPLAPQNSWLGNDPNEEDYDDEHISKNDHDNADDDDDDGDNGNDVTGRLFDTSIFHDTSDPNGFKLPSVFANSSPPGGQAGIKGRHNRVVPTVSEQTFIDSNLRNKRYFQGHYDNNASIQSSSSRSSSNNNNNHQHHHPLSTTSTTTSLPSLDPTSRNLVSMKTENDNDDDNSGNGINENRHRRGLSKQENVPESSRDELFAMTSLMEAMRLESENTKGSLLMDESYVPMSVTITRLSHDASVTSPDDLRHKNSETSHSTSVSSKMTNRTKSKNSNNTTTSSSSSNNNPRYCTCKDPRPLLIPSTSPCPCCLRTSGSHETGCPKDGSRDDKRKEVTLACNLCGKPITNRKRKDKDRSSKRSKETADRKLSGTDYTRNPTTPETAINRFKSPGTEDFHNRRKCSSGSGKERETAMERRSSKYRTGDPSPPDHRVRFDDNITRHVIPDYHSGGKNLPEIENNDGNSLSQSDDFETHHKKFQNNKLFVKRPGKLSSSVNIPNLGVSVHAMAYDLALKDARVMAATRKKGRSKGTQPMGEISNGTVFSYFPLLKRPLSENAVQDLGLKTQEARKVKGKSHMKHIFGKVNLSDYYPGGKKWREC